MELLLQRHLKEKEYFSIFSSLLIGKNVFASVVDNSLKLFGFIILPTKILRMVKNISSVHFLIIKYLVCVYAVCRKSEKL